MNAPLIWLHEEALRITHPVFKAAPAGAQAVFVWDDAYFRETNHSLKRLIFTYETLCELPIDILHGDTLDIVRTLAPSRIHMPATSNPLILKTMDGLRSAFSSETIEDETFALIKHPKDCLRFFPYWKKAEKNAFQRDGGIHA